MTLFAGVAARLSRSDMLQTLVIAFVALGFVLAIRWPTVSGEVNEVWFVLAPVRTAVLALAGVVFGAIWGLGRDPREARDGAGLALPAPLEPREGRMTLLALWAVAALTWPLEIASHAASYPSVSFAWSAALPFLTVSAFMALGAWLGAAARRLRVVAAAPLLVIAATGAALWLESVTGVNFLNPAQAVIGPSPVFVALSLSLAASLVPLLLRRTAEPRS